MQQTCYVTTDVHRQTATRMFRVACLDTVAVTVWVAQGALQYTTSSRPLAGSTGASLQHNSYSAPWHTKTSAHITQPWSLGCSVTPRHADPPTSHTVTQTAAVTGSAELTDSGTMPHVQQCIT